MTVQVQGTLTDAGGNPAPNAHILFKTTKGFAGTLPSADLTIITDANGGYDFPLSIGIHLMSVRYGNGFEALGKTIINADTPTPLTLSDLLRQTEPLLPEEIIQVNEMLAEVRQLHSGTQTLASQVASAADQVALDEQSVTQSKQTVESLAFQVSDNAAQVDQDKQVVAGDRQAVDSMRQQVADNTTQVAQDKATVATDRQAVTSLAQQVSDDAEQVSQDKSGTATLKDLAKRWAVGLNPPPETGSPTDNNNARYWALMAKNNANQTFVSGGYFTPTPAQEYPDITGVERDTIWLIKFTNPGDYHVFAAGDLAGSTLKNGFMLVYDTPQNVFDFIPTTLSGVAAVNGVEPDPSGNVSIGAENLDDVYSQEEVDQKLSGKANVEASYTKTESNDLLNKKADKTEVVLLDDTSGVAKLPSVESETIPGENPSLLAGAIWYDPVKQGYRGHNGEEETDLGGGGTPNYLPKSAGFVIDKKKAYSVVMSDGVSKAATVKEGMVNGDWFELDLTAWAFDVGGLMFTIQFGRDVLTNGQTDYSTLRLTAPCIIAFSKIQDKWHIVKHSGGMGDYGALEKRVGTLETQSAIVESGTDGENGWWTKWADGTMIVHVLKPGISLSHWSSVGALYQSGAFSVNWPQPFFGVVMDSPHAVYVSGGVRPLPPILIGINGNGASYVLQAGASNNIVVDLRVTAIGRWK